MSGKCRVLSACGLAKTTGGEQMSDTKLLPCPACGSEVELKWIAGMSRDLVEKFGHPFGGQASWYIYCPYCHAGVQGKVTKGTYKEQERIRKKLVRFWNNLTR